MISIIKQSLLDQNRTSSIFHELRNATQVCVLCWSGQPCKFVVVTTGAGCGTLAIMVEGPARVAIVCTEVDEGYEFSYTPTAPGDYLIVIKYCNVTIAGCPHKAVITGD